MELVLQTVHGKTKHQFHSHRLLKVLHEPAAYLVPHRDGWRLFPLPGALGPVSVNQAPLECVVTLLVGDQVKMGSVVYVVATADSSDAPDFPAGEEETYCQVFVGNADRGTVVKTQALLGGASCCDIRLPNPAGGESPPERLALLARVRQRWLLYEFPRRGANLTTQPWVALEDDDQIMLAGLTFSFQILGAEEVAAYAETDAVNLHDTDQVLVDSFSADGADSADHVESSDTENSARWDRASASPQPQDASTLVALALADAEASPSSLSNKPTYDPLKPILIQQCLWLKQSIQRAKRGEAPTPAAEIPLTDACSRQLNTLLKRFEARPLDAMTLTQLAEFARVNHHFQAWRIIVKEQCKLFPTHAGLMLNYIEACFFCSQLPDLHRNDKLKLLQEADDVAQKLTLSGSDSTQLQDLRWKISAEQVILQLKH